MTMRDLMTYDITPVPKPRQTRRDRHSPSKAVLVWRAFADECRLKRMTLEPGDTVVFAMPMPAYLSKKAAMRRIGTPHQQDPDLDNLIKGLLDAVYPSQSAEDNFFWRITAAKLWSFAPAIIVKPHPHGEPLVPAWMIESIEGLR